MSPGLQVLVARKGVVVYEKSLDFIQIKRKTK
jgi:hypothetical protein